MEKITEKEDERDQYKAVTNIEIFLIQKFILLKYALHQALVLFLAEFNPFQRAWRHSRRNLT